MEQDRYVLPEHPAGSDNLAIELYSEQHVDPSVKVNLSKCFKTFVSQEQKVKVLILGARGGLTAEVLLPYASQIDLVDTKEFENVLRERFEKKKEVQYFFGK